MDRFLLRVLLSVNRYTFPAIGCSIIWGVGRAAIPVVTGAAIDRALAPGDRAQLILWILVLIATFTSLTIAYRLSWQLTTYAEEIMQHRLRATLSRSALHPRSPRTGHLSGSIVSTMTNDVMRMCSIGLMVFPVAEAGAVVFIAVALLVNSWPLGVAVLLGSPIAIWLMGKLSGRFADSTRAYQDLLAETVGWATDLVAGYRVIKGIRAEEEATARYRSASRRTLQGAFRNLGFLVTTSPVPVPLVVASWWR